MFFIRIRGYKVKFKYIRGPQHSQCPRCNCKLWPSDWKNTLDATSGTFYEAIPFHYRTSMGVVCYFCILDLEKNDLRFALGLGILRSKI